ncbi:TPA: dynamin family protein [Campylobacter jejuni]|nr:dynamin family protein [Campylobacter jejuni]
MSVAMSYNFLGRVFRKIYAKSVEQEIHCALTVQEENIKTLKSNLEFLNTSLQREQAQKENLNNELKEKEKELAEINLKYQITSNVLNAKNHNKHLEQFKNCLYVDWYNFSIEGVDLNDEVEAFIKLQQIEKKLELICAYPKLYENTIIAVGGGFSSGKSEFISSFIEDQELKLATDIKPTTAIPTYVFHDEENKVLACTKNGAFFNLQNIEDKIYSKLSHSFITTFGFNLKDIVPYMILGVHMSKDKLCFIDTPGYNPAGAGYTDEDSHTAKEFLNNASTLFWLIGLDSNGTIGANDLKFLENLNLEDKELFIILNKADTKALKDLEDILDVVEETLEDYDINFKGISAYSSIMKKEYAYRKTSLIDFLDNVQVQHQIHESIIKELYEIDVQCQKDLLVAIDEKKKIYNALSSMAADILQLGYDDFSNPIYARIEKLKALQNTQELEVKLKELGVQIEKFKNIIDEIFGKISPIKRKIYTKDEVQSEVNFDVSLPDLLEDEEELVEGKNPKIKKKKIRLEDQEALKNKDKSLFFNPFSWSKSNVF